MALVVIALALILTTAACICLLFFSPLIAHRILNNASLVGPLRLGALLLGMSALYSVLTGVLSGIEMFNRTALMAALQSTAILFFCIVMTPRGHLNGLIGAYVAGFGASVLFGFWFSRPLFVAARWGALRAHAVTELVLLLRFSVPNAICGLLVVGSYW